MTDTKTSPTRTNEQEPTDADLKQFRYADGGYASICLTCTETFTGDKRAHTCRPCAVKMWKEQTSDKGTIKMGSKFLSLKVPLSNFDTDSVTVAEFLTTAGLLIEEIGYRTAEKDTSPERTEKGDA